MWSVRMRATGRGGVHISGAEGLFEDEELAEAVSRYSERALIHPRGKPERILISVERLTRKPRPIAALPVCTLRSASPLEAREIAAMVLAQIGVTGKAVRAAFRVLYGKAAMRGAALIDASTGARLEPDRKRGVRASRMGLEKAAQAGLSSRLARRGINTQVVKEALVLASKVASGKGVVAELCVSDDPHYTTGYLACRQLGYVRVPNIKEKGSRCGGRVVFTAGNADIDALITYLERTPVLVAEAAAVKGVMEPDELIGRNSR